MTLLRTRAGGRAAAVAATTATTAIGAIAAAVSLTIVDLQPARIAGRVTTAGATVELLSLAPAVNAWFLLTVARPGEAPRHYHLEAADPRRARIALDEAHPGSLTVDSGSGPRRCTVWPGAVLDEAQRSSLAYAPLCGGALYLRNAVRGRRTALEATTQFLRDHVWRGEQIVGFVRREFYADAFVEKARPAAASASTPRADGPPAALPAGEPKAVVPATLSIDVGRDGAVPLGQWLPARGVDGVWVSVAQPASLAGRPPTDAFEAEAISYLVAFDLSAFDLGFALGTEHPRLGWSARVPEARREAGPGPDGIDSAAPLVRTGMVPPALVPRLAATFTGGFKREHGAFRHGALAAANAGSHYGFVEQGVTFSRLVPGLSTLVVGNDGVVTMRTWTTRDDDMKANVRHARQNGVALVEPGRDGVPAAGALIDQWGAGNWSGSADERLRTLRAGACLLEDAGRRYLVYGWFSTATPRTMAQVFLAYRCRYAMLLDMNALEHTYLALYRREGSSIAVEHLVQGMAVLDREADGDLLPRFVAVPDDRDFFYLVRRER